jgi:uncharacterized protein
MSSTASSPAVGEHLATIRGIYAAFGNGDIPAILERLAEDVRWEDWNDSFAQRAGVSGLRARSGRSDVAGFFSLIGEWEITEFEIKDIMASESQVVADVVIDAKLPNGGRYRDEELHLWTFDDEGKVSRLRHYVDTAKHIAASAGQDTTTR